jgi:glutathione S-transferase
MAMLKVLGRVTSINARKVLWALDEMGVAYEREDWGVPLRDPRTPEFLKLNPNAQVPVIVDDEFVVWESGAILRYLSDRHRSGLWPADPHERALVDQWVTWQSTELNPTWSYAVPALLRKNPAYGDADRIAQSIGSWGKEMRIVEAQLARSGGFVANGRFSLADIVIALSTHRWMMTPFEHPALPAIEAHYQAMKARPAGARYLGEGTP